MDADIGRILAERKERWRRFCDMASPQRYVYLVHYDDRIEPDRPQPHPARKTERIEWAWRDYLRQCDRLRRIDDDSLAFLSPYTGTEIFAAAFGCPVRRPEDNMPYARPLIRSAAEVSRLRVPAIDAPPLGDLFDIADELRRRAGPDALMKLPDIQSPAGIAALIWEKERFFLGLIDAPEAVKELADKVEQLLTAFVDEWFRRYGTECVAHFPDYYVDRGLTLSEDEIGSVSRGMFEEFFLPHLVRLSQRYGSLGIHCCAWARHHWESLKKVPNLRMLNLAPRGNELPAMHETFAAAAPQMHTSVDAGDLRARLDRFPEAAHLVLETSTKTMDDAAAVAQRFARVLR